MTELATIYYVTGSEAGLSGAEQIRIALETMAQQGGVATTSQIIEAVESVLANHDPLMRLSDQGRASLRFFINKVAVDAGYVYKHDSRGPGWRITPKGHDWVVASLQSPYYAKMLTPIGQNFQSTLSDVYALLDASKQVRSSDHAAAFVRSGVILTVTAWEVFIEDAAKAHFENRIERAEKAEDVFSAAMAVAQAWIGASGDKRPRPQDILAWTGTGWKSIVNDYFQKELSTFNTPRSENVIALFKKYIGFDIKPVWTWPGVSADEACTKLDELVSIRGGLVHRGLTSVESSLIDREKLISMITLVEQLAWTTDVEVNRKLA